ncbi:hypothetical protein [Halalkalibaculum sp. DA384]|uniref:hypothetical protein n=1 Tax=Halalkalibaculum sp. DA384 TaxID=3373606 RepID=UPI00375415DD
MKKITFQRNELYEKVWTKPVSHLTEELGISSHKLYKACEELEIPTPSAGYWAKLRHDKEVNRPELPESDKESFTLTIREGKNKSKCKGKATKTISVPKNLYKPHKLVKQARKNLNKKSLNRFNRVRGGRPLDISVGPDNLDRGLRILDTIIKESEKRGYSVHSFLDNSSRWTYFKIGEDQIFFQLREKGKRRKRKPEEKERSWDYDYEYTPLGKLQLKLFRNKWGHPSRIISDTNSQQLEDRLDEFFFKLESMAENKKQRRIEREEQRRINKLEKEIEEAAKVQLENESARRATLEEQGECKSNSV